MSDPKRVIQVAVPRPLHSVYDYAVPEAMLFTCGVAGSSAVWSRARWHLCQYRGRQSS